MAKNQKIYRIDFKKLARVTSGSIINKFASFVL